MSFFLFVIGNQKKNMEYWKSAINQIPLLLILLGFLIILILFYVDYTRPRGSESKYLRGSITINNKEQDHTTIGFNNFRLTD